MRLPILVLLVPAPALAAVQPCHLDQMVQAAPVVAQVAPAGVEGPDAGGGCVLTGRVARSFAGGLAEGAAMEVPFACENPGGLVGGTIYHDRREVAGAGAVEVHLDADGTVAGYGWGLLPLDAPTGAPAFAFEHLPRPGGRC